MLPLIAITMGDPAGIGPEIILKAHGQGGFNRHCRPLIIGGISRLRHLSPTLPLNPVKGLEECRSQGEMLDVLDLPLPGVADLPWGQASALGGEAAVAYLRKAVGLALEGRIAAITTAPLNKTALGLAGYAFPGHTEMLAEWTGTKRYAMVLVAEDLRVALVTTHLSLQEACQRITQAAVEEVIDLLHSSAGLLGSPQPRIAVTGLNPHAGEGGRFGREELEAIVPAITAARRRGILVEGPFPADTLFVPEHRQGYDIVVAMYHDQGLIPIKLQAFGKAVNWTAGLPIIRTSVDHGTAYDIAGRGMANPSSLIAAVKLAAHLSGQHSSPPPPITTSPAGAAP